MAIRISIIAIALVVFAIAIVAEFRRHRLLSSKPQIPFNEIQNNPAAAPNCPRGSGRAAGAM